MHFTSLIVADLSRAAGDFDTRIVGSTYIGASRVMQHWDVPEDQNQVKAALREGRVDVLTLSPTASVPDEGIEKFARLALERNPAVRIHVQAGWLSGDWYPGNGPKTTAVDYAAATIPFLRQQHAPFFEAIDQQVRELNAALGRQAVFVVPVGEAVIALREQVLAGKVPGIRRQEELFGDAVGHPTPPMMALIGYCHYAVIFRRSPVGLPTLGLPLPKPLGMYVHPDWDEDLNRLLQQIAWDAVRRQPLSGVSRDGAASPLP